MKLVDAHIHLSDKGYFGKTEEIMEDAQSANIAALISNSVDLKTCIKTLRLAEEYPNQVYPALGIHPWNVNILEKNEVEDTIELIREQNRRKTVVAIGEIGLDKKYEAKWSNQLTVFDKMLRLAEELLLPVIIHSRGTTAEIVEMLLSYNLKGVLLHWFSHPLDVLPKAIDCGYLISDGPPVVYSKGIREVVRECPLTHFLTETDGPVVYREAPFNGQPTKPSFIYKVVEAVAEIKNTSVATTAEQIVSNFEHFFNVKLE